MRYLVVIEEAEKGFGAYVPDLPGFRPPSTRGSVRGRLRVEPPHEHLVRRQLESYAVAFGDG